MSSKPNKKRSAKPTLQQDWTIGTASAENDSSFLRKCFVDTGAVAQLCNADSNKSIILGRVGAGKSALLSEVERRQTHVKRIRPQEFSLSYISGSNVLQFVSALGVKLDPVFQALWKHVLCVELIRMRYNVNGRNDVNLTFQRLLSGMVLNDSKSKALEYFKKFGGSDFWETTEVRVQEITKKIEKGLETSLGGKLKAAEMSAKHASKLEEQDRIEIISNVKTFLSTIQMSSLQAVVDILSEGDFSRTGATYTIVIDDLDEQWAEDELRYRLIRALIEVVKRFRSIRCVKILVALRADLLDTVLNATRDSGFQEEKFDDFFLKLKWNDVQLKQLINIRVEELAKQKYTSAAVGFYDIFPRQVRRLDTLDYMVRRTLKRPRDIILFANNVLEEASGKTEISPSIVQDAERAYSVGRSNSLAQEWFDTYPQLAIHLDFLKGFRSRVEISTITAAHINNHLLRMYTLDQQKAVSDPVTKAALGLVENEGDISSVTQALGFIRILFGCLFRVGAIGIRQPQHGRIIWNDEPGLAATGEAVELGSTIAIHPMLYGALGTQVIPESE